MDCIASLQNLPKMCHCSLWYCYCYWPRPTHAAISLQLRGCSICQILFDKIYHRYWYLAKFSHRYWYFQEWLYQYQYGHQYFSKYLYQYRYFSKFLYQYRYFLNFLINIFIDFGIFKNFLSTFCWYWYSQNIDQYFIDI